MHTHRPTRRLAARLGGAGIALCIVATACGGDGVESSVADAAKAADNAADSPTEANIEAAESAEKKASEAIHERYDAIVARFDRAEAKIEDSSRDAYTGFRNDLAAIEADLVKAADSTGSDQSDAWQSAQAKADDLSDAISKHESGADVAADAAFGALVDDLSQLETEIEHGLGIK